MAFYLVVCALVAATGRLARDEGMREAEYQPEGIPAIGELAEASTDPDSVFTQYYQEQKCMIGLVQTTREGCKPGDSSGLEDEFLSVLLEAKSIEVKGAQQLDREQADSFFEANPGLRQFLSMETLKTLKGNTYRTFNENLYSGFTLESDDVDEHYMIFSDTAPFVTIITLDKGKGSSQDKPHIDFSLKARFELESSSDELKSCTEDLSAEPLTRWACSLQVTNRGTVQAVAKSNHFGGCERANALQIQAFVDAQKHGETYQLIAGSEAGPAIQPKLNIQYLENRKTHGVLMPYDTLPTRAYLSILERFCPDSVWKDRKNCRKLESLYGLHS